MTLRNWTIRVRLTLLYGVLVLLAGAALLAVTYVLLGRIIATQPIDVSSAYSPYSTAPGTSGPSPAPDPRPRGTERPAVPQPGGGAETGRPPGGQATPAPTDADRAAMALKKQMRDAAERLREDFRDRTLGPLISSGARILALFALAGLWIGWLVSGRTLRPISQITATARRVADRSLHERIALTGPRDELRELADTFDDMLTRLDTAFDGQRRFVANASHELQTPLAINRTLIEVAMGRPGAPPQVGQLGEVLLEVNARHERLIDGLLTLARSEHSVAEPVPVDLAEVLLRAVDVVRPEARQAGVTVTVQAGAAPVHGDPVLLERMAQNLLQNAIRYNNPDGWVRAVSACRDQSVRLTVANSGPEVARYEVPALFEPFRRLNERVGSAQGTGLGLSIVRSVARVHGGEVTATPRSGGGLAVEVALPAG